jgi:hypothetical protein
VSEVDGTQQRRRRSRRLLITLLVLLLILVAALAVADRFATSYAERLIGDKVSEQVAIQKATSKKPVVTIEGFPFLTQVVDGVYQEIRIELADFSGPAGDGQTVKLKVLDVRATDVRAPLDAVRSGKGDIVAGQVTGTAIVDYPQLVALIGEPGVTLREKDGKLVGSMPVTVLGLTTTLTGTAELSVRAGALQVRFTNVSAEGLPDILPVRELTDSFAQSLSLDIKLPVLPLKLAVLNVAPQADGLHVTAAATEVTLNSSGL